LIAEKVKEIFTDWVNGLAANFFCEGITKLGQRLDKCLNRNGDYLENKHV
jgi:hypothetical protein